MIYLETAPRGIKKKTPQYFEKRRLSKYRFVTTPRLFVWEGPSQKAKILDSLILGQVVRVLYKKKNWTHVEYVNQNTGEFLQGWVFTRYIKKFKKV